MTGRYKLLGPEGSYTSDVPGELGGHRQGRIYGRLDCPTALRFVAKGTYQKSRVFFANEAQAIASGFRPCNSCMKERYKLWKAGGEPGSQAYPWKRLPPKK